MRDLKFEAFDRVFGKCKNLQKINTISIFFYVDDEYFYCIEYDFNKIDFELWKIIIKYHKIDTDGVLFNHLNQKINEDDLINCDRFHFTMKSKNSNLYRNINLIFFSKW